MKALTLNQKIFVTTTCYVCDQFFKLESTTVKDVVTNDRGERILLGEGHFGACTTRSRKEVAGYSEDIRGIFEREIDLSKTDDKKVLFIVEVNRAQITISKAKLWDTQTSLANGKEEIFIGIDRFSGGSKYTIRNGVLPANCFHEIEEAYKFFELSVIGNL